MLNRDDVDRFNKSKEYSDARSRRNLRISPRRIRPNGPVINSRQASLEVSQDERFKQKALNNTTAKIDQNTPFVEANPGHNTKHKKKILILISMVIIIVALVIGGAMYSIRSRDSDPIPLSFQKAVSFKVYYPDISKLPMGYSIANNSYSLPAKNVLVYAINYSNGRHLDVSLQTKPSSTSLKEFISVHMPLNKTLKTPIGEATIGVINNQAVASLPTRSNTWIILSGPLQNNQAQLQQILISFED
jgi:flagellar basal body-associated protein FliL